MRKRVQTAGLTDEARVSTVVARVVTALTRGVPHPSDGDRMQCEGTTHPDFARYPVHAEQLTKWLTKYLRSKKVAVDPETLKALAHDLVQLAATKAGIRLPTRASSSAKRRTPDRLAVPDDVLSLPSPPRRRTSAQSEDRSPHQPTLFPLTHDYTG